MVVIRKSGGAASTGSGTARRGGGNSKGTHAGLFFLCLFFKGQTIEYRFGL